MDDDEAREVVQLLGLENMDNGDGARQVLRLLHVGLDVLPNNNPAQPMLEEATRREDDDDGDDEESIDNGDDMDDDDDEEDVEDDDDEEDVEDDDDGDDNGDDDSSSSSSDDTDDGGLGMRAYGMPIPSRRRIQQAVDSPPVQDGQVVASLNPQAAQREDP